MIIKKGKKHPITLSGYPNENWTGDIDYFVIDDTSDLGKKILQYAPFYDEIRDENGELIDIVPTERPPEPPQPPTETELLGQQLVGQDLQNLELQNENQTLGQQLVDVDLRLLQGGL